MTHLPIIGDPKRRGPVDIAYEIGDGGVRFVEDNAKVLIPSAVAAFVAVAAVWYYFGLSWPGMPNWFWVAVLTLVVAAPYGWLLGRGMASGLYESDVEVLSIQNPSSGDQQLKMVDPDRFADMQILNHNDKKREHDFLHRVRINGVMCWEVDDYDAEANRAVASWQAGQSNSSIRADRRQIKRIKTDLEKEADKAIELLANYPEIIRKHASEVANRLVKASVGIEVPEGEKLHESLTKTIEDADPSQGLLGEGDSDSDNDDGELSNGDGDGDIFDRAAAMENGHSSHKVVADD